MLKKFCPCKTFIESIRIAQVLIYNEIDFKLISVNLKLISIDCFVMYTTHI